MLSLKKIFNKIFDKNQPTEIETITNGIFKNLKTGEYWNWYSDPANLKESKKWQEDVFLACGETIFSNYYKQYNIFGNYTLVSYEDELNKVKIERKNKINKINDSRRNL